MKKIFNIALATIMLLSFASCSRKDDFHFEDFEPKDIFEDFDNKIAEDERVMAMEVDDTSLRDVYGLDDSHIESYSGRLPMMVTHAEEYLIVKVRDGKMDEVKEKIMKRQEALDEQWATYLPDQHDFVKDYKLVENGDYLVFAIGYNAEEVVNIFNSRFAPPTEE